MNSRCQSLLPWGLYVILPPIIVFILLEVACIVLWWKQEQNLIYNSQTNAVSFGKTSANDIQLLMNQHLAAISATANFISLTPFFYLTQEYWEYFTLTLNAQAPFYQLDAEPNGTITLMSTPWLNSSLNGTLTVDQELAWQQQNFDLGRNRLDPNNRPSYWPSWQFDVNSVAIGQGLGNLSIIGPWSSGPNQSSIISVRKSLFLPTMQGGLPPSPNTSCPPSACMAPDGSSFWGFISTSSRWSTILDGLSALKSGGLNYALTYPLNTYGPPLLDSNGPVGSDALCNDIFILNSISWKLCYDQPEGWKPSWTWVMYLVFTVVCLAVSALLFFVLKGRFEAKESLAHQRELNIQLDRERRKQVEWNRKLHEKKLKLETLMIRQYDLLEHFMEKDKKESVHARERSHLSNVTRADSQASPPNSNSHSGRFEDKIKAMRDQLASSGAAMMAEQDKIILYELLGQGTFGAVYLGEWRGTECAVKQMILPAGMDLSSRAEKMAIMEVAISSSISHPHLVQTYTYKVKAVDEEGMIPMAVANNIKLGNGSAQASKTSRAGSGPTPICTAYHIQMVLEYCDGGSLRTLLNGTLQTGSRLSLSIVLDFASDVVRGMLHLHNQNILHLDLKAANVMLKSGRAENGTASEGWIAKVADFGLSVSLGDTAQAELQSQVGRGTRSHMAPELLLEGRYSKATDIYAFGITLWEIFTCCIPYDGIPAVALGKMVVYDGLRLDFPYDTPIRIRRLIEACWNADPTKRPSFEYILNELTYLSDRTLGSKSNARLRSREPSRGSMSGRIAGKVLLEDATLPPVEESSRNTPE